MGPPDSGFVFRMTRKSLIGEIVFLMNVLGCLLTQMQYVCERSAGTKSIRRVEHSELADLNGDRR